MYIVNFHIFHESTTEDIVRSAVFQSLSEAVMFANKTLDGWFAEFCDNEEHGAIDESHVARNHRIAEYYYTNEDTPIESITISFVERDLGDTTDISFWN